jgi:hypothetical protein
MILKIGLILLCNYNFYGINSYKVRLLNVPAQVIGLTNKYIMLEYDVSNIKNFKMLSDKTKFVEIEDVVDATSQYLNCKEKL